MRPPLRIELWLWPLAAGAGDAEILSEDERARAARFVREAHRQEWIAARAGLRRTLGRYLDARPETLRFDYGHNGRPSLRSGPEFNLSHSGGFAALAVCDGGRLGLDIEAPRPIEPEVAKHFFSPAEQDELSRLPPRDWLAGFYNCWTRKEAMVKALGTGLSLPLDAFDVTLSPAAPARLTRLEGGRPEDWCLLALSPPAGLVGALAVQARGAKLALVARDGWPLAEPCR